MNKRGIITTCLLLCTYLVSAQLEVKTIPGNGLSLRWKIVTNNYDNKPQSRCGLLFSESTASALPPKGWKLYFNFARQIIPGSATGGLQIQHLNGDYFCLSPTAGFKGIDAGTSLEIEFTSTEWLVNRTDAPDGFYLVWGNSPANTYPVAITEEPSSKPEQYLRSPQDNVGLATPESIFAQNSTIKDIPADSLIRVFPTPVSYHEYPGSFTFDGSVNVIAPASFKSEAHYLKETLSGLLAQCHPHPKTGSRVIVLLQKAMDTEAYELTVSPNRITITASSGAGIFYGIQSLKTLIDPLAYRHRQKTITIKNVIVKDKPRFGYRALMLDVARNFQTKGEIFKLLDVMSLYKLNVLHLHLTDDEGWRLEIPGLPELTSVGGRRGHPIGNNEYLPPSLGSGPDVKNDHGSGYYNHTDFIKILKYANERHIRIIPEIESPGHARAAIKAMDARYKRLMKLGDPENAEKYLLHDLHDTSRYISVQYWNDNVVDVSLPSTYRFISTITTALIKMYREAGAPLETIHFGGDEVPAGAWQGSPAFKNLQKTDTTIRRADNLWLYYYSRVDSILKANRLYLTAWEETGLVKAIQNNQKINVINQGLLNRNVHLEVWNNVLGWGAEDLAYKQANAGYKVILSCVSNLYFDMASEKAFDEPGYYWGGYVDVDKLFKFIPFNYFRNTVEDRMGNPLNRKALQAKEQLTPQGRSNIVGLQGALWGETLKGSGRMEYMLLPKLLGLAERAWAADPEWATSADSAKATELYNKAWCRFVNLLGKRELPRLDYYAGGFNYRIPQPGAILRNNTITTNAQFPGFKMRYTLDGKTPNAQSPFYTAPIPYCKDCIIKLALFNGANRRGRVVLVSPDAVHNK